MNPDLMHFIECLLSMNYHFTITSAKRSLEQNRACNGAPTSQHLVGEAIDFKPFGSTSYNNILGYVMDAVSYDQFIAYDTFFHISFGSRNRRQYIDKRTLKSK